MSDDITSETLSAAQLQRVLGSAIRLERVRQGLRISDVARGAGISTSGLSDIERGVSAPSLITLHKIAYALVVDMRDLLEHVDRLTDVRKPRACFDVPGQLLSRVTFPTPVYLRSGDTMQIHMSILMLDADRAYIDGGGI